MANKLFNENCLETMKRLPDNSIDAIVTDPPYGWSFMSKHWDKDVPTTEIWKEVYRVLKPGGYMLVACGTRTYHRMVTRIEDAGFYVKDMILWAHAMGFPKSLDISKALDKELKCEREVIGLKMRPDGKSAIDARPNNFNGQQEGWHRPWMEDRDKVVLQASITAPTSDLAKQYDGYGTQLKPAIECFALLQKPISEKTIAKNVMKYGTGGINIDNCRISTNDKLNGGGATPGSVCRKDGWSRPWMDNQDMVNDMAERKKQAVAKAESSGRFPSNLILDGSQEVLDLFPITKSGGGNKHPQSSKIYGRNSYNESITQGDDHIYEASEGSASRFFYNTMTPNDKSRENAIQFSENKHQFNYGDEQDTSASRFFYVAKASKSEKNTGLENKYILRSISEDIIDGVIDEITSILDTDKYTVILEDQYKELPEHLQQYFSKGNFMPTVKPLRLMEYLVRLITPPNGIVYDPFSGSGTTLVAAINEGFCFIGSELDPQYYEIANCRVKYHLDKQQAKEVE